MSIFSAIYKSFCDKNIYKDVVFTWKWKVLFYFFLLILISLVSTYFGTRKEMEEICGKVIEPISKQISNITVKDGIIELKEPIELKLDSGIVIGIVSPRYLDAHEVRDIAFAAEKDRFSFYLGDSAEINLPFSDIKLENGKLSESFIGTNTFVNYVYPFLLLVAMLSLYMLYSATLGLATFILSLTLLSSLGFIRSVKLAIIAMTPATCFNALLVLVSGTELPGFVFAFVSMGVVYYILKEFSKDDSI